MPAEPTSEPLSGKSPVQRSSATGGKPDLNQPTVKPEISSEVLETPEEAQRALLVDAAQRAVTRNRGAISRLELS